MLENGFITAEQADAAKHEPLKVKIRTATTPSVHAEYVAETVRQLMFAQYGDETYTRGLNVYTTLRYSGPGRGLQGLAARHHGL